MPDYKSLPLKREALETYVTAFAELHSLTVRSYEPQGNNRTRILIGRVGIDDSMVDLLLNKDGTTTVNFKIGKNQELGEQLAAYLLDTVDPNEFIDVNFTLKGICADDIQPILEELGECKTEDNVDEFTIVVVEENHTKNVCKVTSEQHQDSITVSHFKTTNVLMIQGKPLFSYRRAIYLMSELLDLAGLQSVLSREESNTATIVRSEIAKDYLCTQLSDSYEHLPQSVQELLLSGCCVKLASPNLPEYSMLLFPDLRGLEGVLKDELSGYGMIVGEAEHGFGSFFTVNQGRAKLEEQHHDAVGCQNRVGALEKAYTFFRNHRNSLFHMEDFADASRKVDTLDKALSLSKDCYSLINQIYAVK